MSFGQPASSASKAWPLGGRRLLLLVPRAHQAGSHGPLPLRQRLVADRQISPRFLYLIHVELGGMASQSRLHLHSMGLLLACLLPPTAFLNTGKHDRTLVLWTRRGAFAIHGHRASPRGGTQRAIHAQSDQMNAGHEEEEDNNR